MTDTLPEHQAYITKQETDVNATDKLENTLSPPHKAYLDGYAKVPNQPIELEKKVGAADKHEHKLHWACQNGNTQIAELLIEQGADVGAVNKDENDTTALQWAWLAGSHEMVKRLIEKEATTDKHGYTPLHLACLKGDTQTAKLLIEQEADINATDLHHGYTPLHLACLKGYAQTAELLIEHGANVDKADKYEYTPLRLAFEESNTTTGKLLIDNLLLKDLTMKKPDFLRKGKHKSLSNHWDEYIKNKMGPIKELLSDYLEHLESLQKGDKVNQKVNLTKKLLDDLEKDIKSFRTVFGEPDTKNNLSEHRSNNVGVRMLRALRCILTLGLVSKWSLLASRGEQVYSRISNYSAAFFPPVENEKNEALQKHPTLGNS